MAETLALGTAIVDTVGAHIGATVASTWTANDVFFDLIRDKDVIGAMVAEVIGEAPARSYKSATGKGKKAAIKKAAIKKALAGDGFTQVSDWTPAWLAFPQRKYTARKPTSAGQASA